MGYAKRRSFGRSGRGTKSRYGVRGRSHGRRIRGYGVSRGGIRM
jgi:hypothetical protein